MRGVRKGQGDRKHTVGVTGKFPGRPEEPDYISGSADLTPDPLPGNPMAPSRSPEAEPVLSRLLAEHQLSPESLLYREVDRSALTATDTRGRHRIDANPAPSESVVDVYGPGYVVQAETVGAGLAFSQAPAHNWQETMELRALRSGGTGPVLVEVRLGDLLQQGGLMYPVESVTVERAWYFTLPAGSVEVQVAP